MTDLTREGWDAARERLSRKARDIPLNVFPAELDGLVEAALGCPCPPEPPPEPFVKGEHTLVKYGYAYAVIIPSHSLRPDEADAMAGALVEHARYAREQEAQSPGNRYRPWSFAPNPGDEPICGRVLVGQGGDTWDPVCQKPNGHADFCQKGYDE